MQPAASSTSTIEPRALGSTRRSASVPRSAPDARTAAPMISRLRNPPVPMTSRDPNSRSAMTNLSATLHRLHDLHASAVGQSALVPAPARHHLAVDGHGDAAAFVGRAGSDHCVAHARALPKLTLLAV